LLGLFVWEAIGHAWVEGMPRAIFEAREREERGQSCEGEREREPLLRGSPNGALPRQALHSCSTHTRRGSKGTKSRKQQAKGQRRRGRPKHTKRKQNTTQHVLQLFGFGGSGGQSSTFSICHISLSSCGRFWLFFLCVCVTASDTSHERPSSPWTKMCSRLPSLQWCASWP
jgi:hypothetical protein